MKKSGKWRGRERGREKKKTFSLVVDLLFLFRLLLNSPAARGERRCSMARSPLSLSLSLFLFHA